MENLRRAASRLGQATHQFEDPVKRHTYIRYATSSEGGFSSPMRWSVLGPLLTNGIAKVAYVVPVAGYIILYSDYFQWRLDFSKSLSWGFLTFRQRADMTYFGSLILLLTYGLYWWRSPRLLRGKRNVHQFITDIVVARDIWTIIYIFRMNKAFLSLLPEHKQEQSLSGMSGLMDERIESTLLTQTDYDGLVPRALTFFFNWRDFSWPKTRVLVFVLTVIGYSLLLIPASDLFLRVMYATFKRLI